MPSQSQLMTRAAPPSGKPLGSRNQGNLNKIFAASPLPGYSNAIDDDYQKAFYQSEVLDGTVSDGFGFPSFSTSYADNGAPNLADVETGGGGKPASPYVPNLNSPGPGITSPSAVPEYAGDLPLPGGEYGSGLGSTVSPSVTSAEIQTQTLGSLGLGLTSGRSYPGSDGRS